MALGNMADTIGKSLVAIFRDKQEPVVFAEGDVEKGGLHFLAMESLVESGISADELLKVLQKKAKQVTGVDVVYDNPQNQPYCLASYVVPIDNNYVLADTVDDKTAVIDLKQSKVIASYFSKGEAKLRASEFVTSEKEDFEEFNKEFESKVREIADKAGYAINDIIEHNDAPTEYLLVGGDGRLVLSFNDSTVLVFDANGETVLDSIQSVIEYDPTAENGLANAIHTALTQVGRVDKGLFEKIAGGLGNAKNGFSDFKKRLANAFKAASGKTKNAMQVALAVHGALEAAGYSNTTVKETTDEQKDDAPKYDPKTGKKMPKQSTAVFKAVANNDTTFTVTVTSDGKITVNNNTVVENWNEGSIQEVADATATYLAQNGGNSVKDTTEEIAEKSGESAETADGDKSEEKADAGADIKGDGMKGLSAEIKRLGGKVGKSNKEGTIGNFVIDGMNLSVNTAKKLATLKNGDISMALTLKSDLLKKEVIADILKFINKAVKMNQSKKIRASKKPTKEQLIESYRKYQAAKLSAEAETKEPILSIRQRAVIKANMDVKRKRASGGFGVELKDSTATGIADSIKHFISVYDVPLHRILYSADKSRYSIILNKDYIVLISDGEVKIDNQKRVDTYPCKTTAQLDAVLNAISATCKGAMRQSGELDPMVADVADSRNAFSALQLLENTYYDLINMAAHITDTDLSSVVMAVAYNLAEAKKEVYVKLADKESVINEWEQDATDFADSVSYVDDKYFDEYAEPTLDTNMSQRQSEEPKEMNQADDETDTEESIDFTADETDGDEGSTEGETETEDTAADETDGDETSTDDSTDSNVAPDMPKADENRPNETKAEQEDIAQTMEDFKDFLELDELSEPDEEGVYTLEKDGVLLMVEPTGDYNYNVSMGLADMEEGTLEACGDLLDSLNAPAQLRQSIVPKIDTDTEVATFNAVSRAIPWLEKPTLYDEGRKFKAVTQSSNPVEMLANFETGEYVMTNPESGIEVMGKLGGYEVEKVKGIINNSLAKIDSIKDAAKKLKMTVDNIAEQHDYRIVEKYGTKVYVPSGVNARSKPTFTIDDKFVFGIKPSDGVTKTVQLVSSDIERSVKHIEKMFQSTLSK